MKLTRLVSKRLLSKIKDVESFYGKRFGGEEPKLHHNNCSFVDPKYGEHLSNLHPDILEFDYGCGSPIPPHVSNLRVVDLGSGSGKDCFILSQLVGSGGYVIGVDMTEEALDMSRSLVEYHTEKFGYDEPNVEFRFGNIEDLKSCEIEDNDIDLVVSNCVINLSENKENVLGEVFRILKPGGEMYFSDIYCDMRVPEELQAHSDLWGECISGSLYMNDFANIIEKVGFANFQIVDGRKIEIDEQLYDLIEGHHDPQFYSLTIRLFKPDGELEDQYEENFGQNATFLGTEDCDALKFDSMTLFKKGVKQLVSSRTAELLEMSRYPFVVEEKKKHRGRFKRTKEFWEIIQDIDEHGDVGTCC